MIFFDLGWTLEDETPAQRRRAEQTAVWAAQRGVVTTAEEVLRLQLEAGREGAESVYPRALARLGFTAEEHLAARREFPWDAEACTLVPEAQALLSRLPGRLGMIANQSRSMAPRLKRFGIFDLFDVVICSSDVGVSKPDPEIFLRAMREAAALGDYGPHWMVGDRVDNDVVPAKRLGWRTIRLRTGDYRLYQSNGPAETPDAEVESLGEAVKVLIERVSL